VTVGPALRWLEERLRAQRAWFERSAFRKLLAATLGLALVLAGVMTLGGFLVARRVIQQSVLSELSARAELATRELELTVGGVMDSARALARNGIVTGALVDSQGRELYLLPLLRDMASVAPVPIHLAVVDYRGRTLGCSLHQHEGSFAEAPWIPSVTERGETRIDVERGPDGAVLRFAQPVIFPGTGRPEGALVVEIPLGAILAKFRDRRPNQVLELVDPEEPGRPTGAATLDDSLVVVEHRLTLGGDGRLRLRLGLPHEVAFGGLHRFAIATLLGVMLAVVIVLLVGWRLAMRLTAGVRELSLAVVDAAVSERPGIRVPARGEDEVGALGAAFNALLARLEAVSAAQLAEQVERRQGAERALLLAREAVEQAVEAIEVVDSEGRVAFSNGAAARLRGVPADAAVGRRWEELFDRDGEWWSGVWRRLRGERSVVLPLRIHRDGETIPVAVTLVYFELDGEEHCIATVRDVREQLRAEATERLASLGTLAAGVAHEINNPLAYVLGNLSFVRDSLQGAAEGGLPEEERRALVEAIHGAERVRDVVRSLRAYSRPGQGPPMRVDVAAELSGALKLVGNTIRHHARVVEQLEEVPAVLARPNELGQVFVNLLVNAGQALRPDSGRECEISVRCHATPDGRVAVEVSDTGVGIPLEVQPHIFEPFFTTKAVGDGTGLGLSICHGIVTRLGGTIGFESEPGKGTRFTVLLPAAGPVVTAERSPRAEAPRGRILVVDDDPAVTRALARVLGRTAEVSVETDPERALGRLAQPPFPDAILCDVMMPGVTGPIFLERLRATDAALARRVVFITGGAISETISSAVAATGQPCVEKPPDPDALARAIASVRPA
jgi:PAS domain S-box-containing protein